MEALELEKKLNEARDAVKRVRQAVPQVGVVLGSGLGGFAGSLGNAQAVPYSEIPHMPPTSVSGHAGHLHLGTVAGVEVACLQGRAHLYEGHPAERVVFGVRLLAKLGCFAVLLTNAAGGIRTSFKPGSLMLVSDHINLTGQNPLLGPNVDALGTRFPDMSRGYDPRLAALARDAAHDLGIRLEEGVYAGMLGPSYETPAEVRMLKTLGADAVGMSTVLETIAVRHMGARVLGLSCLCNMAAGISPHPLTHEEVKEAADAVASDLIALLRGVVAALAR